MVLALAMSAVSAGALAQTADETLRRDLLAQAEQARDAGEHARSVDLATRAAQLRMTPSLGLLIAQEHEQLGHVVDALDHARRCAADASIDGTLRNRDRIGRNCRELATALAGQVARVTVRMPADTANATVMLGTRSVPPAGWEVPVAVDPGDVVVRVSTPDGRRFERTVRLERGGSSVVTVALEGGAVADVAAPPRVAPPVERPRVTPPETVRVRRGAGAGPWVVVGLGAAGLVAAGVLWSMRSDAITDRDRACDVGGCDPSAVDADNRAIDLTLGTNVAIGIGSAAVAGGLAWFLIARMRTEETTALRPSAWVLPGGAGLSLRGAL